MRTPQTAQQVLEKFNSNDVVALELAHGNSDLIRDLKIAGMAGPFKVVDPWRLEDEKGEVRINARGYPNA